MRFLIDFVFLLYMGLLLGFHLVRPFTGFIRAKGLWLLVPFRVSGWRSRVYRNKVYPLKWVWEEINFADYSRRWFDE